MPNKEIYRRNEAAAYTGLAAATLAKLASIGGGPKFRHYGRWPVYHKDDLDKWLAARTSGLKASTSDPGSLEAVAADYAPLPATRE